MKKYTAFALLTLCITASAQNTPVAEKTILREAFSGDDVAVPTEAPKLPEYDIYNVAGIEKKPEFPGGINQFYSYIAKNVRVSDADDFMGGKVFASFVVEKDGSLADVKIIRDTAGFGMAEEVVRVLKMSPKWSPGEQNGKAVRTIYTIPVNIKIPVADEDVKKK